MNQKNFIHTEYNQPLMEQRADPYVYRHTDGNCYFTASVPEYDRIVLRQASTLAGLAGAKERTLWHKHESGPQSLHIWAPEIHCIDGEWYIYYAAGDKDDEWEIRPYVLKCTGNHPMRDEWVEMGRMKAADNDPFSFRSFSLDATIHQQNGRYYYIWAEKTGVGKQISNLYIALMETPVKLATAQVLLTTPDYDWERVGFWVNEGPDILEHGDKLFLTFSASETGIDYCIGMLYADKDADLLDPLSWTKLRNPVLRSDGQKGIYGPGHNCFVKADDGVTDLCIYHARFYDEVVGNPLYDPNRHAMVMRIKYDDKGFPVFAYEKNPLSVLGGTVS